MYDTAEEAQQKLANSTVLFNGIPVHILRSTGEKGNVSLEYTPLPYDRNVSNPKIWEKINHDGWDFRGLASKLGYVTLDKHGGPVEAVFCSRMPTRSSRQGIDDRTCLVSSLRQAEDRGRIQWSNVMYTPHLRTTINDTFPSIQEALKTLFDHPKEVFSVAIKRKLMLTYDMVNPPNLVYRNEKIGYTEDGERVKLAKHKLFLKEELEDMCGLKCA